MASLIPTLNSCIHRMHAGEKRLARCLETLLEDDYLCWYELPVGIRQRYTDFIIMHPLRGLLLLEVKDWKLDSIQKIDKVSVTILGSNGCKTVPNPMEQARQCAYQLIQCLERDPQLRIRSGPFQGRLAFPYGFGVVFGNITRHQFESTDLGEVLPQHQVICKDEILESSDPEVFQKRLWDMFNVQFSHTLSLPQIERIRWHLFPEIRIGETNQSDLFSANREAGEIENLVPDIMNVMDTQQELLARSLGEGHRIIHGVAGSGKTLILGYRCLYLARLLHKPILVLCYNIVLAVNLRHLVTERGVGDKVHVYHFHDWCGEQLRTYHIDRAESVRQKNHDAIYDQLVNAVISAVEKGRIPRGQYGAVLIDEGHDFKAEWLKLVVGMVDPETNSLLLLYDDAQSIYSENKTLDFSLSSVGIQARGRTTILKLNYRNTDEILRFAYRFASQYLTSEEKDDDHVPLLEPESVGRHGPAPVVRLFDRYEREVEYIAHVFRTIHATQAIPWSDMCVTYFRFDLGKKMHAKFVEKGIPCQWLCDSHAKKRFDPRHASVKIMTMHSCKGLEFPLVAVSGVGQLPGNQMDYTDAAKLLYVAMTRATDKLLITGDRETAILAQLKAGSSERSLDESRLAPVD